MPSRLRGQTTEEGMMPQMESVPMESTEASVRAPFDRLRAAYRREPYPSFEQRIRWLDTLAELTKTHQDEIVAAVSADFGHRSAHETKLAECFPVVELVKYIRSNLSAWMRPERRDTDVTFLPARNEVRFQPLGVVGVISPWNYPFQLAVAPLAYALAAGNRVLLKPSELTPNTSALLHRILRKAYDPDVVDVVVGGAEVASAFTALPFDHIVFTGSTRVGKLVMRAAAANLTPVTLELGGKSPCIVHEAFSASRAAARIAHGKLFNAGQTCIAPDYVLVHQDKLDATVAALREAAAKLYPAIASSDDYTAIVNEHHRARLDSLVEDAVAKGAKKISLHPSTDRIDGPSGKMAPVILTGVTDTMDVMQEEIFGPVLPIVTYRSLHEALEYVNDRPRPLALYYFDDDSARADEVLTRTTSGGVCVNETLLHFVQHDLPFGGVGPSGMGAYHGREGFETSTHARAVVRQRRLNGMRLLAAPYGARVERLLDWLLR